MLQYSIAIASDIAVIYCAENCNCNGLLQDYLSKIKLQCVLWDVIETMLVALTNRPIVINESLLFYVTPRNFISSFFLSSFIRKTYSLY